MNLIFEAVRNITGKACRTFEESSKALLNYLEQNEAVDQLMLEEARRQDFETQLRLAAAFTGKNYDELVDPKVYDQIRIAEIQVYTRIGPRFVFDLKNNKCTVGPPDGMKRLEQRLLIPLTKAHLDLQYEFTEGGATLFSDERFCDIFEIRQVKDYDRELSFSVRFHKVRTEEDLVEMVPEKFLQSRFRWFPHTGQTSETPNYFYKVSHLTSTEMIELLDNRKLIEG